MYAATWTPKCWVERARGTGRAMLCEANKGGTAAGLVSVLEDRRRRGKRARVYGVEATLEGNDGDDDGNQQCSVHQSEEKQCRGVCLAPEQPAGAGLLAAQVWCCLQCCLSGASMKLRACGAPERTRPQLQTEGSKSPLVLRYLSVTSKLYADHILSSLTSCDQHPPPTTRAMTNTS